MCGIVGCAGDLVQKDEDMFKTLLQLDTIRGPHSTGVLTVNKHNCNWSTIKVVGTPWDLFEEPDFGKMMRPMNKVFIGHNRWATRGKITEGNAHPFNFKHIIGVHNGTLRNQTRLDDHTKFEVDSENIYYDMSRNGYNKTIPKLEGAYCLVWWDDNKQHLNFIRNHERPMFLAMSEDSKCVYWSSEKWMLIVASSKHGVKIKEPFELPINTLVSYHVGKKGELRLSNESGKLIEGYKYVYTSNVTYTNGNPNNKPKDVVFEVVDEVFNQHNRVYMYTRCEIIQGEYKGCEARVYAPPALRKKLMGSLNFWVGDTSWSMYEGNKQVFAMAEKTCVEIEEVDGEEQPDTVTIGGKTYSPSAAHHRVVSFHGCAWCGDVGCVEDVHKFIWNSSGTECLCEDCADTEALQYFHKAG